MSEDGTLPDMTNERLRRATLRAGFDVGTLAEAAEVSGKSVERWIRGDVVPYPRTRYRVAAILHEDESYLWPQAVDHASMAGAELVTTRPHRSDVHQHLWTELLRQTDRGGGGRAGAGRGRAGGRPGGGPAGRARAE